eukprot:gene3109-3387_t
MHTDGDLAAFAYSHGYKLREPGLGAAVLKGCSGSTAIDEVAITHYRHGLFNNASHVFADSGNGLIWTDNKLGLQYTLWSKVKGLGVGHAGLHVIGTRVTSITTSGAMFTWDIADLAPQEAERDLDLEDDDADDTGSLFKGDTGWRDMAFYGGSEANIVLTYDLETQRVKNLFLGHLFQFELCSIGHAALKLLERWLPKEPSWLGGK